MRLRLLLIVFTMISLPLGAQERQAILRVSGIGAVAVAPDMAAISVAVEVFAPTADRAVRLNSARMKDIFKLLKARGIDEKDVQTSQFSLYPRWSDQKQSQTRPLEITGFTVNNALNVKVRNLDSLGSILDSLTKIGANRIQSVQFMTSDTVSPLDRARQAAVADGLRKAALIATAAGHRLGPVRSIDETRQQGTPTLRAEASFSKAAVPIAPGQLTFTARVTMEFALN